jgi:hypothetical protein
MKNKNVYKWPISVQSTGLIIHGDKKSNLAAQQTIKFEILLYDKSILRSHIVRPHPNRLLQIIRSQQIANIHTMI